MYGNDDYTDSIGYDGYYSNANAIEYEGHTGDPHLDLEYDRQYYKIPDMVKKFITYFRNAINEGMIFEIQNFYESSFPKLTEQYFEKRPWPEEADIAPLVENDPVFLILYKELYFRHIYARIPGGPSFEQRIQSFYNYCDLFNYILNADQPVPLELPDLWLWELVDEFVYQFQTFAQYRARGGKKSQDEIDALNQNKMWNVFCILNMLGYFSLVGLLRLHSLLGDYYQAIKVLENMEIHKKVASSNRNIIYSHVPACQITTSYYVGFAYMMMRRYADAIQTFSAILLYIQRTKQLFQTRSYQNDQINKQTDQMYTLLAICLVLHPMCVDESIQQALREKNFHEKMYKMQYGDLQSGEDSVKEAMRHQTNVFMDEVRQQKMLPTIRSYLKLYTTLPVSKLATFMAQQARQEAGTDVMNKFDLGKEIEELTIHLLCFKHKMKNLVWSKGASDTKVAHRYGEFFIRKILKFEELHRKLKAVKI
ncbi:hypothetical protein B566_EDAN003036 [Ephemera danica]|nr:hypothetical protein B566_EDAN003036 [Ephemera danica]